MQEQLPEQPVPRIIDLDYTGRLIIAFDKKMKIPEQFSSIPDQKVAILKDATDVKDTGVVAQNQKFSTRRMLQTNSADLNLTREEINQIDILPLLEL